jgi:hypothetical protein
MKKIGPLVGDFECQINSLARFSSMNARRTSSFVGNKFLIKPHGGSFLVVNQWHNCMANNLKEY